MSFKTDLSTLDKREFIHYTRVVIYPSDLSLSLFIDTAHSRSCKFGKKKIENGRVQLCFLRNVS